jgi:AcrR family transcriptional regulator
VSAAKTAKKTTANAPTKALAKVPAKAAEKAALKAPPKRIAKTPGPRKASAARGARTESPAAPRLGKEDWLQAAFQSVVEGGFDKARVLLLAERLKVTRGSFYWHFSDHAQLIEDLLARWLQGEQEAQQRLMAIESTNPRADLAQVLEAALAHAGPDLENMRFELALRGVGRRDAQVAGMLAEVDQQRMALFEHKFRRLTRSRKKAAELAALFYLAIVGSYQALSRPGADDLLKAQLVALIASYLVDAQKDT